MKQLVLESGAVEVAFVAAPGQNLFFEELGAALRWELRRVGVRTSVHVGVFPPARQDLVYVLVPPHEYFTLMEGRPTPPDDLLRRTIFICAEQPGTPFFDWNLQLAPKAGAVFDINRLGVRAFKRHGVDAIHLQVGWTPAWDAGGEATGARDVDVVFMGAASDRRLTYLSSYTPQLRERHCRYVISDNSLPNSVESESFLCGAAKWDLLRRTRIMVNLHQGDAPYFEWLRVVQALGAGAVVVSEHSVDYEPLRPGRDLLFGRPETLGFLTQRVLEDPELELDLRRKGHRTVREELALRESAERVARAAGELAERPIVRTLPFRHQRPPSQRDLESTLRRLRPEPSPTTDPARRALKELRLEMVDLRRSLNRLSAARGGAGTAEVLVDRRSTGWFGVSPRITVLVSLYNYGHLIARALDSVVRSAYRSWEIVVVDDGSSDDSLGQAGAWAAKHDNAPVLVLRHPVNRGLAVTRNTALGFARGEYSFVLDADNEIYPDCFERLVAMLDDTPGAAFAYGMLERVTESGFGALMNVFPWDPARFRLGNYIDAMAMIRTAALRALGGYRTDRRLFGWEDYDLWCRMAEHGMRGAHFPAVVARYRASEHSMLSVTNISDVDARSAISDASPTVMSGR